MRISDWSSDVCSSDLATTAEIDGYALDDAHTASCDREVVGADSRVRFDEATHPLILPCRDAEALLHLDEALPLAVEVTQADPQPAPLLGVGRDALDGAQELGLLPLQRTHDQASGEIVRGGDSVLLVASGEVGREEFGRERTERLAYAAHDVGSPPGPCGPRGARDQPQIGRAHV